MSILLPEVPPVLAGETAQFYAAASYDVGISGRTAVEARVLLAHIVVARLPADAVIEG